MDMPLSPATAGGASSYGTIAEGEADEDSSSMSTSIFSFLMTKLRSDAEEERGREKVEEGEKGSLAASFICFGGGCRCCYCCCCCHSRAIA